MSAKGGSAFGGKKQSVVSSILWLTIAEIFFNLSGYIIHASLGRMLGPADYGRYGLVVTLSTMIIMLIGNGIPTAMSKYISEFFETTPGLVLKIKRQAAILQAILIGLVTLIFYLASPLIAKILRDESLTPLLRISAFIIPSFAAASFYLYYYIGIHRFNLQSTMKIIRSFARIILVIGLAYIFGVKGSVSAYILAPAVVFLSAWAIDFFWVDKHFPKNSVETFNWKKLLNYAWPVTLFMLFYELLISLDLYFVKALLADDSLTGIYNASLTVARIPYYLFYALTMVMLPSISRSTAKGDKTETNRIITQTFRMMVMLLVPIAVFMMVYADPLIRFFFGGKYAGAVPATQILIPGVIFLTIFYVMCFALNGAGKIKIPMYTALFGMILNAILNYFFVLKFGIAGSALATAITSVVITIFILIYAQRFFCQLIKFRQLFNFVLAGVVMYLVSFYLPPQKWIFLLWGMILTILYMIVLTALGEFTKKDLETYQRIIFRKNKKAEAEIKEEEVEIL